MKLSAPIFILKQQAKSLSRKEKMPLHQALDRIANREGFKAWSLLAANAASDDPGTTLLAQLDPGDLVLVGSRPGQGKTLLSLDLAVKSIRRGNRAAFFTLYFTRADVADCLRRIGEDLMTAADSLLVDDSDGICADYIIGKLASAPASTLVIIDYLQLLDEKRESPTLIEQVRRLKSFARERGLIVICLSQIKRSYDPSKEPYPGVDDVRLPNPLDLRLFDRTCFLNQGRMRI